VVVREAVDNALRHAFPNHIEGRIWVRLFQDRDGRLTLTVRDNGIGMPDFADYDSGGRGRIMAAARALNAYARMGAAPFGGALVSIICPS
jgi:two-component sensor histidine kinase